mmetsp:Transcript_44325/g.87509  ORF Transcript_44325/g.87509 Transcript_44325/m.87509 type:complete len:245 (-) Transcript_44325:1294-2028(-)
MTFVCMVEGKPGAYVPLRRPTDRRKRGDPCKHTHASTLNTRETSENDNIKSIQGVQLNAHPSRQNSSFVHHDRSLSFSSNPFLSLPFVFTRSKILTQKKVSQINFGHAVQCHAESTKENFPLNCISLKIYQSLCLLSQIDKSINKSVKLQKEHLLQVLVQKNAFRVHVFPNLQELVKLGVHEGQVELRVRRDDVLLPPMKPCTVLLPNALQHSGPQLEFTKVSGACSRPADDQRDHPCGPLILG